MIRIRRAARCIREVWAELVYAQRRLLDIPTGLSEPSLPPRRRQGGAPR